MHFGGLKHKGLLKIKIGESPSMPIEVIYAYAILKKSCALANYKLNILEKDKSDLIASVCNEIVDGQHNKEFPLVIWQTGSGTQTNMNINEVISNRANLISGKTLTDEKILKANDHVNMSQSSNDRFKQKNIGLLAKIGG